MLKGNIKAPERLARVDKIINYQMMLITATFHDVLVLQVAAKVQ